MRELDTATLKSWMGHAKLTTTERYLHAKPRLPQPTVVLFGGHRQIPASSALPHPDERDRQIEQMLEEEIARREQESAFEDEY